MQSYSSQSAITTKLTTPPSQYKPLSSDPVQVRASVSHLLTRAFSLPCSTAAQAFVQLVQPSARFQLALEALLPILDSDMAAELPQRILVSFILYSLYAPHPVTINPFKSALFVVYIKEREKAVRIATDGGVSPNEQFVWVLWKILKGDGNDIGPYSPSTLSRCPLPPKLRAVNLVLDEDLYNSISDIDDITYLYFQDKNKGSASSDTDKPTSDRLFYHVNASVHHVTPDPSAPSPVTFEEDRKNERLIHAMKLLLAARERVLSLSEQRALTPIITEIANSNFITTIDLTPIIATNPTIAHPLLVALLTNPVPENNNPRPFLDILPFLPPTLATFDLYGRLLQDQTRVTVHGYSTVADLVLMEVLGRFVHESINWLDRAERDAKEGNANDDRFTKGVRNLCRFYTSLIKLSVVDPTCDADSTEMAHFSLRHARFEEANSLYRLIATSRF